MSDADVLKVTTGITLSIRSRDRRLEEISRLLGIRHTGGFEKGERFTGKQKVDDKIVEVERQRSFSVWHFCTVEHMQSPCIADHARLFLSVFSKCGNTINDMIRSDEFYVCLSIWNIGYSFCLPAPLMEELARFAEDVNIVCWDISEAEGDLDTTC